MKPEEAEKNVGLISSEIRILPYKHKHDGQGSFKVIHGHG